MKVTNNRIGGTTGGLDTGKAGKTDGASALDKSTRTGALSSKEGVKDSAKVDVSARAQQMQKAKEIASRPDTVDEAKVARLQKLIDEGNYKIDADAIADRLVDEHMTIPD